MEILDWIGLPIELCQIPRTTADKEAHTSTTILPYLQGLVKDFRVGKTKRQLEVRIKEQKTTI